MPLRAKAAETGREGGKGEENRRYSKIYTKTFIKKRILQ
jgi:hypothetical protein